MGCWWLSRGWGADGSVGGGLGAGGSVGGGWGAGGSVGGGVLMAQ